MVLHLLLNTLKLVLGQIGTLNPLESKVVILELACGNLEDHYLGDLIVLKSFEMKLTAFIFNIANETNKNLQKR